jgi:hypothetical protein
MTRTTSPAEHDPFFQLLTEALRAGPGSPQWGEAVAKLRDGGVEGADEYTLILRAREDVELGRDFRKVSAGPGFTRKVLEAVEREGTRRNGIPTATIVAILSGLVILGVIITVIVLMSRGGDAKDPQQVAIDRLQELSMPVSVASGSVPGTLTGFDRDQAAPSTAATKLSLTRIVSTQPLDPAVPAILEAELELPAGSDQTVQLFVGASGDASAEVSWNYRDGRASVDVDGVAQEGIKLGAAGETVKVGIRFDREVAIVEAAGRRLFAGAHKLGGDTPRVAGVRFAQPAGGAPDVTIKSLTVAQAASPAGGG